MFRRFFSRFQFGVYENTNGKSAQANDQAFILSKVHKITVPIGIIGGIYYAHKDLNGEQDVMVRSIGYMTMASIGGMVGIYAAPPYLFSMIGTGLLFLPFYYNNDLTRVKTPITYHQDGFDINYPISHEREDE